MLFFSRAEYGGAYASYSVASVCLSSSVTYVLWLNGASYRKS